MRLEKFIEALKDAGWRPYADAQYDGVRLLHASIYPDVAQLEDELADALASIKRMGERLNKREAIEEFKQETINDKC